MKTRLSSTIIPALLALLMAGACASQPKPAPQSPAPEVSKPVLSPKAIPVPKSRRGAPLVCQARFSDSPNGEYKTENKVHPRPRGKAARTSLGDGVSVTFEWDGRNLVVINVLRDGASLGSSQSEIDDEYGLAVLTVKEDGDRSVVASCVR